MATSRLGPTSQKVLLLLLGGITLGLSGTPRRYHRVLKSIRKEWENIDKNALYRAIRRLYTSKLIRYLEHRDGSVEIVISEKGEEVVLRYKLNEIKIQKYIPWDYKWRLIIFDIPETKKKLRDSLRYTLNQMGMVELQKSVFVNPYECKKEIEFMIEFYNARSHVRYIEATHIDNELHLKKKFGIHE